jgi:hypothetical protein
MLGSFFDLPKLFNVCESYGQAFANYMMFFPGLKTVRLVGELKKCERSNTCTKILEEEKPVMNTLSKNNTLPSSQARDKKVSKLNILKCEQSSIINQ